MLELDFSVVQINCSEMADNKKGNKANAGSFIGYDAVMFLCVCY